MATTKKRKRVVRRNYEQMAGSYVRTKFRVPLKNPHAGFRSKLKPHDRVAYSRKYLVDTGTETSEMKHRRGTVSHVGNGVVGVVWDNATTKSPVYLRADAFRKVTGGRRNPVYKQGAIQRSQISVYRPNPKASSVDATAARELKLSIDNDGSIYAKRKAIEANLAGKVVKGTFDVAKAAKGYSYLVEAGAKSYLGGSASVSSVFNKATRDEVARMLAREYAASVRKNPRKRMRNLSTAAHINELSRIGKKLDRASSREEVAYQLGRNDAHAESASDGGSETSQFSVSNRARAFNMLKKNPRKRVLKKRRNHVIEGMYAAGRQGPGLTYGQMMAKTLADKRSNPRKIENRVYKITGAGLPIAYHQTVFAYADALRLRDRAHSMGYTKAQISRVKVSPAIYDHMKNGISFVDAFTYAMQEAAYRKKSKANPKKRAHKKNCACAVHKKNPTHFPRTKAGRKGVRKHFTLTAYAAGGARIASESRASSKATAYRSAARLVGKTLKGKKVAKVILSDGK